MAGHAHHAPTERHVGPSRGLPSAQLLSHRDGARARAEERRAAGPGEIRVHESAEQAVGACTSRRRSVRLARTVRREAWERRAQRCTACLRAT